MFRSDSVRQGRTLGVAAVLFLASAVPLPDSGRSRFGSCGPDKLLHLLGHAAFARSLATTLGGEQPGFRARVTAVAVSSGFGLFTELLQTGVPGRRYERGDVLACAVGSVVGVAVRVSES